MPFHQKKFKDKKRAFLQSWSKWNQKTGIYKESKGDYGFVDIIDENGDKKGYYVHFRNKKDAMDGDEVAFESKLYKGKEEAIVLRVVKRANRILVGKLQISKKWFWFVIPQNPAIKMDIFISEKHFAKAKDGQIVGVEILSWKWKNPEWKIVQILGNEGDRWIDVFTLALEWGAKIVFPEEVVEEAKKVSLQKYSLEQRKDLRELFTVTIDGEDAKDLDDAVSVEIGEHQNYRLYVHIADVTNYVRENSLLDREALERGTSIYLTDRVIPMLPEELSNGVCSLNTGEDKLTLTCEMDVDKEGKITGIKIYESIIKTKYRLTYNIVEKIKNAGFIPQKTPIDESGFEKRNTNKQKILEWLYIAQEDKELCEMLKHAFILKERIEKYRKANGYLSFNFDEAKIEIDENGDISAIKKREKLDAHKLIEHFMISANESVSKKFASYPFLYRIHPEPNEEDVEKAIKIISNYVSHEKHIKVSNDISIERALEMVAGNNFLSRVILRSLTKAVYSEKNEWHFWLGLEFYSHFTSPIRRYPDLQIHRIIKEKLHFKLEGGRIKHYKDLLKWVWVKCSEKEQSAEKIERNVLDLGKVKFMKNKIGEVFSGKISGMIQKWFFVELENTVEGFVDIHSLQRWSFTLLEEVLELKNFSTGEVFWFGDVVKIKVKNVDEKTRRIDFELLE